VGIRVTFCIAQKVTKKSSDTKNSPIHLSIYLASPFAVSLISFPFAPFFGFMAKKWPSSRLKQFRVTAWVPIRDVSFLGSISIEFNT
jgi:hypothetical protein